MLILGIEMIFDSGTSATKRGWYIAAIALALSIYAGFPEVAYFDGLFALAWAIIRLFTLPRAQRPRVLRRLGLGGFIGVVLSLPVLIPFDDFLKVAFIGSHTAALDGVIRLPNESIAGFFDPYVFGTIFSNMNVQSFWGEIGGYFGAGVCVLALVGLFGPRLRTLRIFLAAWTLAGLGGALDILHSRVIWNLIPLVNTSSFPRYIMPSCEICVILLAAFGLADFTTSTRSKRLLTTASIVMALVLLWCVEEARSYNKGVVLTNRADVILIGLACLPWIAVGLLLILGRFSKHRVTPFLIALVVVGEGLLYFFVPTAESPKRITVDYAPIHFLQKNLHQERYLDFAVLYPNWGSYFDLNSLSSIDLPYPKAMKNFIEDQLYPGLDPGNQFVVKGGMVGVEALESEVVKHFKAYENASVKYLLIPSSVIINPKFDRTRRDAGLQGLSRDDLSDALHAPVLHGVVVVHGHELQRQLRHRRLSERRGHPAANRTLNEGLDRHGQRKDRPHQDGRRRVPKDQPARRHVHRGVQVLPSARAFCNTLRPPRRTLSHRFVPRRTMALLSLATTPANFVRARSRTPSVEYVD